MRPKHADFIEEHLTYKKSPGPGNYQEVELVPKKGRFTVSKFGDSPMSIIHPRTERFGTIKQSPGPSNYVEGDSLNGMGKYVLSGRHSNGCRVFSKTARGTFWNPTTTPGPGSY